MNIDHDPSQHPSIHPAILARLERLERLEAQLRDSGFVSADPNVVIRAPGADYRPTAQLRELVPSLEDDFFDSKLDDTERRKFLSAAPRNLDRDQEPPKLPDAPLGTTAARHADAALRDIQYRLVGLTRPLDWFLYQSIHANWTPDELLRQSQSVARDTLSLLADVASHVSDVRIQSLLADAKLPRGQDNLLISPEEIIELATAKRRLQDALQPPKPPSASNKKKGKGKRRPAPANASTASGNQSSSPASDSIPASSSDASVGFSKAQQSNGGRKQQHQRRN
ncbi:hypothetical protein BC940DRAFT_331899 [Gongronella butleri]|nr:hypothetical protein BC940DRAFT_331899 [Gongronella butleri]